MQRKAAVQGLIIPVAYEMGRQCPAGLEPVLLAGLEKFWPELTRTTAAKKAFLQGLEDRFNGELENRRNQMNKPISNFDQLAALANEMGAEGIWLIRGAKGARLTYIPVSGVEQPEISGIEASINLEFNLEIADAGVLMIARFPNDGGESGIEVR